MRRIFDLWRRAGGALAHGTPDSELLTRYVRHHDDLAFAELVARHGPLVYGACRRLLLDPLDVEDAFQAAFLVLVRRATELAVRPLGPWLHRVALLTARNLRRRNATRRAAARALDSPALPSVLPDTAATDARLDVDVALAGLPHKYRVPLVLCHLQGWTRREAAEHLGCPESTLSSLLVRGLAKLRRRLAGRDPAVVLAVAGSAAIPSSLAEATVRAAVLFHTSSLSAVATPAVADLTKGVLRMFWVKKLTTAGVMLVATALLGFAAWFGSGPGPRVVAQVPAPDSKAKPEPIDDQIRDLKTRIKTLEERLKQNTLELTVSTGQPALELKEFDSDGKVWLRVWPADTGALQRFLVRSSRDPDGPRRLVIKADTDYPADQLRGIIAASKRARYEVTLETNPGGTASKPEPPARKPPYVIETPDNLSIEVVIRTGEKTEALPIQPISGAFQVRLDGTVGLGFHGSVQVDGLTLAQAAETIRRHLLEGTLKDRKLRPEDVIVLVDVLAYNSKKYYVITNAMSDGEQVFAFPCTGNETVLDAIAAVQRLAEIAGKGNVWISRRGERGNPYQVLPVDWNAITRRGVTTTNYQILPGDRLYVGVKKPEK